MTESRTCTLCFDTKITRRKSIYVPEVDLLTGSVIIFLVKTQGTCTGKYEMLFGNHKSIGLGSISTSTYVKFKKTCNCMRIVSK